VRAAAEADRPRLAAICETSIGIAFPALETCMQPYVPFVGVLILPDKIVPVGTSPVALPDGMVIASIRWHAFTTRARFEVLDPAERSELARGQAEGLARRRYALYGPSGDPLLGLKLSWLGTSGRSRVTLPDGAELKAKGSLVFRRFTVDAPDGSLVARIIPTKGWWSVRPDSYALELTRPVLSPVQAIGLVQFLRAAERSQRQSQRMRTS
jgi:hypothetical protein